jgi:putative ABC transport system permease protein
MIRNYIVIALRSLWRNRTITLINLVGMSVGFGLFLIFWSWTRFDLGYDRFHEDIGRMYFLRVKLTLSGSEYDADRTGGIYASLLPEQFPQIYASCRVSSPLDFELGVPAGEGKENGSVRYFHEDEILAVDTTFFDFFSFRLKEGNRNMVFSEKDRIVITESLARKLFGDSAAMGRTIRIGEGDYYRISGVVEDPPVNSSYRFRALLGIHIMEQLGYPVNGYGGNIYYTNFKVAEGSDIQALNKEINENVKEFYVSDMDARFHLDPMTKLHMYGESRSIIGVYISIILAVVILCIACINFINLTTASSFGRLKEITIRKSAGAGKRQLIFQFMTETYMLLLVALYLGFFLAEQLAPVLSRSFEVKIPIDLSGTGFWLQVSAIFLVTGLLAGLYPAVKIAGFRPHTFLQGMSPGGYRGGSRSRKLLIVMQFSFSVFFIIITIFTGRQFVYLRKADLGFNREDMMYVRTKGKVWDEYPEIKQELSGLHFVKGVASGSEVPVLVTNGDIEWGEREGDHNRLAHLLWTDAGFLSAFDIDLVDGTYYSEGHDSLNATYVVINRSMVDLLGWEEPVGHTFYLWGEDRRILGVTEDIHFFPFNVEALGNEALIYLYEGVREYIFIRLAHGISSDQVASIEAIFRQHNPGYEFEYDFVGNFAYEALENTDGIELIFLIFTCMAIMIAIMGLIGLSIFNNTRRTKEVGIRKAMGAHTGIIMRLLLSEFMKLVILSNLIALPLAYLVMRRILQFFSYSVDLKAQVFVLAFLLSLFVSLVTVAFHAYRIARSNPVISLRYE